MKSVSIQIYREKKVRGERELCWVNGWMDQILFIMQEQEQKTLSLARILESRKKIRIIQLDLQFELFSRRLTCWSSSFCSAFATVTTMHRNAIPHNGAAIANFYQINVLVYRRRWWWTTSEISRGRCCCCCCWHPSYDRNFCSALSYSGIVTLPICHAMPVQSIRHPYRLELDYERRPGGHPHLLCLSCTNNNYHHQCHLNAGNVSSTNVS